MDYEKIAVERDGSLIVISFNDPQRLNAMDETMRGDFIAAMDAALEDDGVRAILLTGAGRGFCSGANLKKMFAEQREGHTPDVGMMLRDGLNQVLFRMKESQKPIVSAVNGPAVGVGCGLALAADIVLVARSAYFLQSFINLGVVPDGGSSWTIPRLAGLGRATAMMMLGERIGAEEAVRWGLALRMHEDGDLVQAARTLALTLANGPTLAYGHLKAMLANSLRSDFAAQLEMEASCQEAAFATADCQEGVAAFVEKRAPRFRGA